MRELADDRTAFLKHPFRINEAVFHLALKIGIVVWPDDGEDAEVLLKHAELALKQAKRTGVQCVYYDRRLSEDAAHRTRLESQMREALRERQFVLHYQPKISLTTGELMGAEALIRWNEPTRGLMLPGQFIPVLEEIGMIQEVGQWVLRTAIQDHLRWLAAGYAPVRIAVNVSPLQLRGRAFAREVRRIAGMCVGAAAGLELEVTERLMVEDVRSGAACLEAIHETGVTIAIDDFGTGFSSLSYLANLSIDKLKIDRSFVAAIGLGPRELSLVSTIINLGHSLNLTVVAEGVETEEQARLLRLMGCDEMQGFLISAALPADVFESTFLRPAIAI